MKMVCRELRVRRHGDPFAAGRDLRIRTGWVAGAGEVRRRNARFVDPVAAQVVFLLPDCAPMEIRIGREQAPTIVLADRDWRKLPPNETIPEAVRPQGLNLVAGTGFEPVTFGL